MPLNWLKRNQKYRQNMVTASFQQSYNTQRPKIPRSDANVVPEQDLIMEMRVNKRTYFQDTHWIALHRFMAHYLFNDPCWLQYDTWKRHCQDIWHLPKRVNDGWCLLERINALAIAGVHNCSYTPSYPKCPWSVQCRLPRRPENLRKSIHDHPYCFQTSHNTIVHETKTTRGPIRKTTLELRTKYTTYDDWRGQLLAFKLSRKI